LYVEFLDNPRPGRRPGDLGKHEEWWVERQQALEQAGYMLRPRYRPGWKPSWAGTNKFYLDFEDGQPLIVSVNHVLASIVLMTTRTVSASTQLGYQTGNT